MESSDLDAASLEHEPTRTGKACSLHSHLLRVARSQLNLMISEVCQLKEKDLDFSSQEKLTMAVLVKISNGTINSVHIPQTQARNYLKLLADCSEKKQDFVLNSLDDEASDISESSNPYFNSPF